MISHSLLLHGTSTLKSRNSWEAWGFNGSSPLILSWCFFACLWPSLLWIFSMLAPICTSIANLFISEVVFFHSHLTSGLALPLPPSLEGHMLVHLDTVQHTHCWPDGVSPPKAQREPLIGIIMPLQSSSFQDLCWIVCCLSNQNTPSWSCSHIPPVLPAWSFASSP